MMNVILGWFKLKYWMKRHIQHAEKFKTSLFLNLGGHFFLSLALFDCLRQHCCKRTNSQAFIIVPWKGWPLLLPSGTPHSSTAYWKATQSAQESWTISQFMISQPFKGWFNICLRGSGKLPENKKEEREKKLNKTKQKKGVKCCLANL